MDWQRVQWLWVARFMLGVVAGGSIINAWPHNPVLVMAAQWLCIMCAAGVLTLVLDAFSYAEDTEQNKL